LVATTTRLAEQIADQLPKVSPQAILVEPCKRDTAPCIGLAAMQISRSDPDATMAVMPSDHVIAPEGVFQNAIRFGAKLVEAAPRRLVTFGIRPTYPAEGFGYIERAEPLESDVGGPSDDLPAAYRVKRFREKPTADVARQYVSAGQFYWNSGIFLWKALVVHLERIADAAGTPGFDEVLTREFTAIEPISIDYAVMEHAREVVVIEAPFDWDDVGSWRALERIRQVDADGNVVDAARHLGLNTSGSIVRSTNRDQLVVTVGVKDLIVIVTPDATLVAEKNDEESIRGVTRLLEDRAWDEYL